MAEEKKGDSAAAVESVDVEKEGTMTAKLSDKSSDTEPEATTIVTLDGEPATEEEIKKLFHIVDPDIPARVWLVALTASAERFVWFGATGPLQNYIQHDRHSKIPGALGLQQATASLIMTGFFAFSYFTPLLGAVVADAWLGRYKTTLYSALVVLFGALVLELTSIPAAIHREGAAAGGMVVAMVFFAFGCGGVRAAVTPYIADQYTEMTPRIKTMKSGERVVADRELTISYIYNVYYWMVNIAGLAALVTTFLEKYVAFWAAYLPPLVAMAIGLIPLIVYQSHFVKAAPQGALLIKAIRALWLAARGGFKMNSAKPEAQAASKKARKVPWDDRFVEELKLALFACRILMFFPFHWLCLNQTFNNLISQAGQMVNSGVPNDAIKSTNPLTGIVFYPLVQKVIYPWLRRKQINFRSCARITFGFFLLAGCMGYAAGLQQLIYDAPPCYSHPLDCPASPNGRVPNQISMFLQIPIYSVGGMAELFCLTTGTEHAYNQAPKSMRSIISSFNIATAGMGALLAMAFTPLAKDPHLVIMYGIFAGILFVATCVFWICFRRIDKEEIEML